MSDEQVEPLALLQWQLAEERRARRIDFYSAAASSVLTLVAALAINGNVAFVIILQFLPLALLLRGVRRGESIRHLRVRIAWAKAGQKRWAQPPASGASKEVRPASDLGAWLAFAGVIVTALSGIAVAVLNNAR